MNPPLKNLLAGLIARAGTAWREWRHRHPRSSRWLPQCAAALMVLLGSGGIGWLFPGQAAKADLEQSKQREIALKQAYVLKLQRAPQTDLVQARHRRARQHLALLEQQLTGNDEQEAVMNEIDAAGLARGLRFTLFKPEATQKEQKEQKTGSHDRTAVQLRAVGSYQAIARFTHDIAHLPRIVILDPVQLQAAAGADGAPAGLLALQATASAFGIQEQNSDNDDNNE